MAKGQSLQDPFLNALRKERIPVSIYLVNGIKLQGQIDSFDQFVVLLRNSVSQMVYKHAISTVVPARNVRLPTGDDDLPPLEDAPAGLSRRGRGQGRIVRTAGAAVNARSWSAWGSAAPRNPIASRNSARWRVRPARRCSKCSRVTRKSAGSALPDRQRQGRGTARARRGARRRPRPRRPRAVAQPGTQSREGTRVPRARPQRPDPRHLRAARAHLRRQAAGRARAAQHMSTRLVRGWTHLERQQGRHRPARSGRNPARNRPPPARRAHQDAERAARQGAAAARDHAAGAQAAARCRRSRWSATPTPASRRCSIASRAPTPMRPTSCSRRSIRRCAGCDLAPGLEMALADTVGFVRDLPHELVAAFRSTLQEAREADLLLHVIDAADPERNERIAQVERRARVDRRAATCRRSPCSTRSTARASRRGRNSTQHGRVDRVWLSAHRAQGVDLLLRGVASAPRRDLLPVHAAPAAAGRARAGPALRGGRGARATAPATDGVVELEVSLRRQDLERICREDGHRTARGNRALCRRRRGSYNPPVLATRGAA